MNTGMRYTFGKSKEKFKTIIYGGIGSFVPDLDTLVSDSIDSGFTYSNVKSFEVDSYNNVIIQTTLENIESIYFRNLTDKIQWESNNALTFIYDIEFPSFINANAFCRNNDNLKIAILSQANVGRFDFDGCHNLERVIYLDGNDFEGSSIFWQCNNLKRVDFRNVKQSNVATFNTRTPFAGTSGATAYVNKDWQLDDTLATAYNDLVNNRNGTLVEVLDNTPPTPPTNIFLSNITSNSVDITFNGSFGSANNIDFYDVYVYDGNLLNKINPIIETNLNSLTVNIPNPDPQINYQILIRAVDVYFNFSEYLESQSFQTL